MKKGRAETQFLKMIRTLMHTVSRFKMTAGFIVLSYAKVRRLTTTKKNVHYWVVYHSCHALMLQMDVVTRLVSDDQHNSARI